MAKIVSVQSIKKLLEKAEENKHKLTDRNYPSKGQSAVQEIYQTTKGKLFLKYVSEQNHLECRVNPESGTLAEREFWSFKLANYLGLEVPQMWLIDSRTTVQVWLDYPDAKLYSKRLELNLENIFDCGIFDWITGQGDRHHANYLYNYVSKKIILIDSAYSFLKIPAELPEYLKYFENFYSSLLSVKCNTKILKKVRSLTPKQLSQLVPLKDKAEIDVLNSRCSKLKNINTVQALINLYRSK